MDSSFRTCTRHLSIAVDPAIQSIAAFHPFGHMSGGGYQPTTTCGMIKFVGLEAGVVTLRERKPSALCTYKLVWDIFIFIPSMLTEFDNVVQFLFGEVMPIFDHTHVTFLHNKSWDRRLSYA